MPTAYESDAGSATPELELCERSLLVEDRWRQGDVILMEEFVSRIRRQLISVRPQIVVHDDHDFLAVLSQPGMTFMSREIPGRNSLSVQERIEIYLKEELLVDWFERRSDRAVLSLYPPFSAHSVRLFWDADWQFQMWYVNLEDPYTRSTRGIEVSDHTLDIVVTADLRWSWKDEPEFEALTTACKIPLEKATAIRAEGERVIRSIENRAWPFNEAWPDWRPDPVWIVPRIAEYRHPP